MEPKVFRATDEARRDEDRRRQAELTQHGKSEVVIRGVAVVEGDGHRAIGQRQASLEATNDSAERHHTIRAGEVPTDFAEGGDRRVQIGVDQSGVIIRPKSVESQDARLPRPQAAREVSEAALREQLDGAMIEP